MKSDMSLEDHFYGSVTVGERGQIVIPSEARKKMNINPGDKMIVMGHPAGDGIVICKFDAMKNVVAEFLEYLERIESETTHQDK